MVTTNILKPHHIPVLHYWNMGIHAAIKIHLDTKVPLSTIRYQLKNLRTECSLQHRAGNRRESTKTSSCFGFHHLL